MDFIADYGLFLAKTITVVAIPLVALIVLFAFLSRLRSGRDGHLEVKHLNKAFDAMSLTLKSEMLPKKRFKQAIKEVKQRAKIREKARDGDGQTKRIFVLDFKGDMRASAVMSLREEITAVLVVATPNDEVVLRLESAGGVIHAYGLAASQLQRLRDHDIPLTVAVDQIAASGGYMMACVANRVIAAPFAIIGSIGVVGQLPNFNRFLKNRDIDFEQHTAGEYKRTLTIFGENTDKDRQKFREELEEAHRLFKDFVQQRRPGADIEKVATGEYWYGIRALEMELIDKVLTSDDHLRQASATADLYQLRYVYRKSPMEKLFVPARSVFPNRDDFPFARH